MDKRYQVFVSSTFADLQHERQKFIHVLMEMDCMPAGMELFPAADEEQWQFIKRIIDDCDYYILILGGRYGSLTQEGISYTEKEFDYAMSLELKVLAFVHDAPDEIPVGKSDADPVLKEKLTAFRQRVSDGRLVRFWRKADDLPGLVALSLTKTIKLYPAIGWVRANSVSNDELLVDINRMRKENERLRKEIGELKIAIANISSKLNLAGMDEYFDITLEYTITDRHGSIEKIESVRVTWNDIFAAIAPDLIEHPNDVSVNFKLGSYLYHRVNTGSRRTVKIHHDHFQTIKVQLSALGLIQVLYSQTTKGDMALFWTLTPKGYRLMVQVRTVKTVSNDAEEAQDRSALQIDGQ